MTERARDAYKAIIRPHLTEKRFQHSVNVAQESVKLAKKYGADVQKAETAGILHDILKDTDAEKQLKMISDFGIIMTDAELTAKKLWHAIGGAAYIEAVLGIRDRDIVNAVRYHTSGRKNMTLLEKIVFVADFISKDRNYPGVEDMRRTAYKSLDKAIVDGIAFTVCDLMKLRETVVCDTMDAYNDALIAVKHGK